MNNQKTLKYVLSAIIGVLIACISVHMGFTRLQSFMESGLNKYEKFDLINLILVSDDFSKYDYLNRSDINLFFSPFLFFLTGLVIVGFDFLLKPKSYLPFVFSRIKYWEESAKYIKGKGNISIVYYVVLYTMTIYICSGLCFRNVQGATDKINEGVLIGYLVLHGLCSVLTFWIIREICFFIYCRREVSTAICISIVCVMLLFILDTQLSEWNIILFNPHYYFIDSFLTMGGCYFALYRINSIRCLKILK